MVVNLKMQEQMTYIGDLLLRTPALPLLDVWWRSSGSPYEITDWICNGHTEESAWCTDQFDLIVFILYYAAIPFAITLIGIKPVHLKVLYLSVIYITLILLTNISSVKYITAHLANQTSTETQIFHFTGHACTGTIIGYIIGLHRKWIGVTIVYYSLPVFVGWTGIPVSILSIIPSLPYLLMYYSYKLVELFVWILCGYILYPIICFIIANVKKWFIDHTPRPFNYLFINFTPELFASWLVLVVLRMFRYGFSVKLFGMGIQPDSFGAWCGSVCMFCGTCAAVGLILSSVYTLIKYYLQFADASTYRGFVVARNMVVIALYYYLFGLMFPQHMTLSSHMAFQVVVSFLASVSGLIYSVLFTLSTSLNRQFSKHLRAITLWLFLTAVSIYYIYLFYKRDDSGIWIFALTSLLMIKCLDDLAQFACYVVRMCDNFCNSTPWHNLDNVLFVIHCIHTVSVLVIMVLSILYAIWSLFFGIEPVFVIINWTLEYRFVSICMHCYYKFNSFRRRHEVTHIVNNLPLATEIQLRQHDDVCIICREAFETARVAPCGHLYHADCLVKCLHGNNSRCPLCQKDIFTPEVPNINPQYLLVWCKNWLHKFLRYQRTDKLKETSKSLIHRRHSITFI